MIDKRLVGKWWVSYSVVNGCACVSAVKQKDKLEPFKLYGIETYVCSDNRESDWLDLNDLDSTEHKLNLKTVDLPFTAEYFDHSGLYEIDILESGNWYIND